MEKFQKMNEAAKYLLRKLDKIEITTNFSFDLNRNAFGIIYLKNGEEYGFELENAMWDIPLLPKEILDDLDNPQLLEPSVITIHIPKNFSKFPLYFDKNDIETFVIPTDKKLGKLIKEKINEQRLQAKITIPDNEDIKKQMAGLNQDLYFVHGVKLRKNSNKLDKKYNEGFDSIKWIYYMATVMDNQEVKEKVIELQKTLKEKEIKKLKEMTGLIKVALENKLPEDQYTEKGIQAIERYKELQEKNKKEQVDFNDFQNVITSIKKKFPDIFEIKFFGEYAMIIYKETGKILWACKTSNVLANNIIVSEEQLLNSIIIDFLFPLSDDDYFFEPLDFVLETQKLFVELFDIPLN